MKKFLKWSTAFLLLGVLAVGCIKNEASEGIEAMRKSKAALLNAQAELEQAKAKLLDAEALLKSAQVAIVQAESRRIDAETELLKAEKAWQDALLNFHVEGWEIQIQMLEAKLRTRQAEVDAAVADWELKMAQIQLALQTVTQAYEKAMLAFEVWKLENIDTLAQALIMALDELTIQIHGTIDAIALNQIWLNDAKGQYLFYVNATYENDVAVLRQNLERRKLRLECVVEHLASVVEAYSALYNQYHGELDELIAGFQAKINGFREEIAQLEILYVELKELGNIAAPSDDAFTKPKTAKISNVFVDGGDDEPINVTKGTYEVKGAWGMTFKGGELYNKINRDIRIIKAARIGADLTQLNVELAAKKIAAEDEWKDYNTKWNEWQANYKNTKPGTGSLWVAWKNAYDTFIAENKARNEYVKMYGEMYAAAAGYIQQYMDFLEAQLVLEDGKYKLPAGLIDITPVLGGVQFNISTLINFVFGSGSQATAFIEFVNSLIGIINLPTQIDGIVTNLKAVMDGTHAKGWDPFWDVAVDPEWGFIKDFKKATDFEDIMRDVYKNQGRDLTEISKQDWHVWMTLYWLFQKRDVEIGLDDYGTLIIKGTYDDAAEKILHDFFGVLDKDDYDAVVNVVGEKALNDAIDNYYAGVDKLTNNEKAMYEPFNREWFVYTTANADWGKDKALVDRDPAKVKAVTPTPAEFTLLPYDHDNEEQPAPTDVDGFFFKLESFVDELSPVPSLYLDDFVYMDGKCNLWVEYRSLQNFTDNNCGLAAYQTADWFGDLLLWEWAVDRDAYKTNKGHFFYALVLDYEYKAIQGMKNRIENGDYEALIEKLEAELVKQAAAHKVAKDAYDELDTQYKLVTNKLAGIQGEIDDLEAAIVIYNDLITMARKAHNAGNLAEDGLISAKSAAELQLIEKESELREVLAGLEMLEQGLIPQNLAPWYHAQVEKYLDQIALLQEQLAVLDAMRAKLLSEYGF